MPTWWGVWQCKNYTSKVGGGFIPTDKDIRNNRDLKVI